MAVQATGAVKAAAPLVPLARRPAPTAAPADTTRMPLDRVAPSLYKAPAKERMDVAKLDEWADKNTVAPVRGGNHMTTLIDGDAYFNAVGEAIDRAKTSIAMVTHTFGDGAFPDKVVDKLVAKAKAGIPTYFIVDWFGGTRDGEAKNLQRLRDAGVKVAILKKASVSTHFFEITHSKIAIFDGREAFVGGHNLTMGGYKKHDVTNQIQGPVVADVQKHYEKIWAMADEGKRPLAIAPVDTTAVGGAKLRSMETTPDSHDFKKVALKAIDSAKSFINVEQAYLTDNDYVDHLTAAAKRGILVRVVVPKQSDEDIIQDIHRTNFDDWLKGGLQVYRFPKDMHTKALSVDGTWAAIGSTNMTVRGQESNFELSMASSDPTTVAQWDRQLFNFDRGQSERMTLTKAWNEQNSVGLKQRAKDWFYSKIVRPFL
jgi:cardiolipin synthase